MLRFKSIIFTLVFLSAVSANLFGQILEPVKWEYSVNNLENSEAEIIAKAIIDDGWHVYAQVVSDDPDALGPIPTSMVFESNDSYETIGKVEERGEVIKHFDPNFDMDLNYFEGSVSFVQKVKLKSEDSFDILAELNFMACDDKQCIFPDPQYIKTSAAGGSLSAIATHIPGYEPEEAQESNILEPVKWAFSSNELDGGVTEVVATATVDEHWHLYAMVISDDPDAFGPIPTSIEFTETKDYTLVDGVVERGEKLNAFDPNFDMNLYFYEHEVSFVQQIKTNSIDFEIEAQINFMTCDDEKCIFPDPVDFKVFVEDGKVINVGVKELVADTSESGSGFEYQRPSITLDEPVSEDCGHEHVEVDEEKDEEGNLLQLFILGFFGGLLALLTPCVFPMIPLTVSFFTKGGNESKSKGIQSAVTYGAFIFIIYILLSVPFHLMDQINENILNDISTNVWLNIFFFGIFVVFAFSFFGYFEIQLPTSLANKMDNASNVGGLVGTFFMALTLAIVSFSCTGPILGSLLAGSLSKDGGAWQLTAGMGGFGVALGIPFALFAAFPGMLKSLPKSGGWLNSVKVVLGFAELALALKFLSNADLVDHWDFLKYELFMGLWIVIFALMALYIFGKIKFPHDSPLKKLGLFRIGFGVMLIAWVIYLGSGFRYNEKTETFTSLTALSGLAPPAGYSWIHPVHCPLNLSCEHDYEKALARAKEENKPVFVDFTGYACVNCRKMEEIVWPEQGVYDLLNDEYIVVSLYVDDKKELPDELKEIYESQKTGNVKNIDTYGAKWSALQIETFGVNSQPYYVLISPEEELLNTPSPYNTDVDEYQAWLECGLETYKGLE